MTGLRYIGGVCALVLLTGCAGNDQAPSALPEAAQALLESFSGRSDDDADRVAPTDGFPGVPPRFVAEVRNPLMGAYIESTRALATLLPQVRNRDVATWATQDGVTVAFRDPGIIVSTRGLPLRDLHVADAAPVILALAAGNGATYVRRLTHLDGLLSPDVTEARCTLTPGGAERITINNRQIDTHRFREHCQTGSETDPESAFTNEYWRSQVSRRIVQSRQWLGPEIGAIYVQQLVE